MACGTIGVIAECKDRRLWILVHRHDRLGRLHSGTVLYGPGDSGGDIELRRDGLASLADLIGVRVPARVHRRSGCADRGAEGVGQLFDGTEVTAGATTTGDDDSGLG